MEWQIFEDNKDVLYLCIKEKLKKNSPCLGVYRIYPSERPGTLTAAIRQIEQSPDAYVHWQRHDMVASANAGKSKYSKKRISANKLYEDKILRLPAANVGWLLCDSSGYISPGVNAEHFGKATLIGLLELDVFQKTKK